MSATSRPSVPLQAAITRELVASQQEIMLVPLARKLTSLAAWQAFMRLHVFAVWDFMSLLKRLQQELTCVSVPWMPGRGGAAARFVHEIILAEESDADGMGGYCSHFDLYCRGMQEAGADLGPIQKMLAGLVQGDSLATALAAARIPTAARSFVEYTVEVATTGSIEEVAALFLYGREDVLPQLFATLLEDVRTDEPRLATLAYYLQRHIEVDGGEHGPMAAALLAELCRDDQAKWQAAAHCAKRGLALRADLWRAIALEVSAQD